MSLHMFRDYAGMLTAMIPSQEDHLLACYRQQAWVL